MGSTNISVQYVSLIVGVFLPLVVAFITKINAHNGLKSIAHLFLSLLSAFLTEAINTWPNFDVKTALFTFVFTFLIGVGSHFGFFKPTEITAAVARVGVR